ncbi:hypothetical protein PINS_up017522 [Pythium insidiosum]|nr:hypothetical protein PINS_up017522 [Pythium insidiosum]
MASSYMKPPSSSTTARATPSSVRGQRRARATSSRRRSPWRRRLLGVVRSRQGIDDLDFFIGHEALAPRVHAPGQLPPSRRGIIQNWDNHGEAPGSAAMFQYLRCEPEEHYVMLTEPPLNPPENARPRRDHV